MSLTPGTRLGPYEILAPIGAGGMGEVYRAKDTKLNRDVAIKVLPESFALDADRVARFTREAQVLASLNHPNIAQIYAVETTSGVVSGGVRSETTPDVVSTALVMELVEGEDLSALIARHSTLAHGVPSAVEGRGIPIADALPIAKQIADALEAAHEQGIVHRDLKPANVKVRTDGTVKVLDFGLAKAMDPAGASGSDAMNSPTLTARATQMGMIIGTAAYMSPEQAKGRAVDKRADIWAFGVVLYEMLTGRRAFEGEDISTTLAAVLMRDPEWNALPADTPAAIGTLIHRCLDRDPKARLRDIGEARVLLSNPATLSASPARTIVPVTPARSSRLAWIVAAGGVLAAVVFAVLWLMPPGFSAGNGRVEASILPPPGQDYGADFSLSPDGRRLVMEAVDRQTGTVALWLRELGSGVPVKLAGTDGGTSAFWSPQGTDIAFFSDGKLKTVDLNGGPPQVVCDAPSPRGGTWGPGGTIVFAGSFRKGLERVDAAGGVPLPLTTLTDARHEKSHRWPVFLPDGKHLLFLAQTGEASSKDDASTIEVLTFATGARTVLVKANSSPLYSGNGFLLFWREGALRGQAFDQSRLAMSGAVFSVAAGVAFDSNEHALASASGDGTLVYSTANTSNRSDLRLVDRTGRTIQTIADSVLVEGGVALSRDGTRLAAAITADGARDTDIWTYDLVRGAFGPLTFDEGGDRHPVWSYDGKHLIYSNDRKNDGILFRRPADGQGQAELVAQNAAGMNSMDVSHDGRWMLVASNTDATATDLFRYDFDSRKLTPLVSSPFSDQFGALSPDDRWLAYQSDETGRPEVYVRSLAADAGRWRISTQGGSFPKWRGDGRELYFLTSSGQLMAVDITPGGVFRSGTPRELFKAAFRPGDFVEYAPTPDGQKFVADVFKERSLQLLTLVTNWTKSR